MKHKAGLGGRFWRLWSALGVSSVGDGMIEVALPLLSLQFTHNAMAVSGVLVCQQLPGLLATLPVGTLADRTNRRMLIVSIEILRFILLGAFGSVILLHRDGLVLIYVTAFLLGALAVAFDVVCGSSLPSIVAPGKLVRANAHLINVEQTAEDMVGRSLGGAAFALARSVPFLVDAATFVASALLLRTAIPDNKPKASDTSPWQDLLEGIRWFTRQSVLRLVASVVASFAFCQAIVFSVLVLYGRETLHLSGTEYGLMLGLASIGVVVGSLVASPIHDRIGAGWTLVTTGVISALAYPLLAATHSVLIATLGLLLETAMVLVGKTGARSLRQRLVPDDMQARAASAYAFIILGSIPLGGLVGGALVTAEGIRGAFVSAGVVQFVVLALVGRPLLRKLRDFGDSTGTGEASNQRVINLSHVAPPESPAEGVSSLPAARASS